MMERKMRETEGKGCSGVEDILEAVLNKNDRDKGGE